MGPGFYQTRYLAVKSSSGWTYPNLTTIGQRAGYGSTCYGGGCNDISSSGRTIPSQTEGVVYMQFLANFGSQDGGGTPGFRVSGDAGLVAIIGGIGQGSKWGLYNAATAGTAITGFSLSTLRYLIVRFDYDNDTMKLWVDPNLSTFDYANPSTPSTEILNASLAQINKIELYFRNSGSLGIDEIHAFKSSNSNSAWSGSTNSDWSTASNWSNGIPTPNTDISIPAGLTNYPTVTTAVAVKSVNLASGTSLIAQNTFAGNITYTRNLATDNWYLVASPVAGETLEDFIANNNFVNGTPPNIGLAPYVNDGTAWEYQTAATTGSIASGAGYSVKLASAGNLTFTGTLPDTDVDIAISSNTNGFNLIGNPYPSYIAGNTSADGTHNLISVNTASLTEATIWLWNQATSSYDTFNLASSSLFISPAQGFFVSSNGSNTFSFTEAMQSHQSDSFQRTTNNRPEINLMLSNGANTTDTEIFYIEGTTTGWDNGYDSSMFGGTTNSFAIYTHLVSDSEGQNLGIQSLPDTDLESMIVPVGINAVSGTEITISVATQNLPDGIDVYLEDKEDGSFTLLESAANYTTTLSEALNGIGRYYLHTSAQVLSTDDLMAANISLYMTNNHTLRVDGVQSEVAQIKVYSMLGKQVQVTSFQGNGMNEILLSKVAKGVYLIQLETAAGILHKKVIIE